MKVPRWLNPRTNPALYTAAIGLAYSIWQAIQVEAAKGPLTWQQVTRIAAGVLFAAAVAWQRGRTTPVADPRDGNGDPLVKSRPAPVVEAMQSLMARQPVEPKPPAGGKTQGSQAGSQTQAALPATPPAGGKP